MPTDNDELLRLWEHARRVALRSCRQTLSLLDRGAGGFYQADDFLQDLFIEFQALATHLADEWGPLPWSSEQQDLLFAHWSRLLYMGGIRVLKRRPQRLWRGREYAVEPSWLDLDAPPESAAPTDMEALMRLPPEARDALVQPDEAEPAQETLSRLDDLEAALWSLRPSQRQIVYLAAVANLSAAEVARSLGLQDRAVVRDALFAARQALRKCRQAAAQKVEELP